MNILQISAWYPNRNDAMSGLFVRKHASAAGRFCNVQVLHVVADPKTYKYEIVESGFENIKETFVYMPFTDNRFKKLIILYKGYFIGFKHITTKGFKPDLIHANILTRAVFFAFLLKIIYGIPYVITEHWSRYLPGRKTFNHFLHRYITQLVAKKSMALLTVSDILVNGLRNSGIIHKNLIRINNVVDDFFFEQYKTENKVKKSFLHISCFDETSKNTSGIIRAAHRLADKRDDFELIIAGNGWDFQEVISYSASFSSHPELVVFTGEKTPREIFDLLKECCCLVQFSNYETAGVTIAEAFACGKPVISTNVGIAPEYVNEQNGVLVQPGDEEALINAMDVMLDTYENYNPENIRSFASGIFSFETAGRQLFDIYQKVLKVKKQR